MPRFEPAYEFPHTYHLSEIIGLFIRNYGNYSKFVISNELEYVDDIQPLLDPLVEQKIIIKSNDPDPVYRFDYDVLDDDTLLSLVDDSGLLDIPDAFSKACDGPLNVRLSELVKNGMMSHMLQSIYAGTEFYKVTQKVSGWRDFLKYIFRDPPHSGNLPFRINCLYEELVVETWLKSYSGKLGSNSYDILQSPEKKKIVPYVPNRISFAYDGGPLTNFVVSGTMGQSEECIANVLSLLQAYSQFQHLNPLDIVRRDNSETSDLIPFYSLQKTISVPVNEDGNNVLYVIDVFRTVDAPSAEEAYHDINAIYSAALRNSDIYAPLDDYFKQSFANMSNLVIHVPDTNRIISYTLLTPNHSTHVFGYDNTLSKINHNARSRGFETWGDGRDITRISWGNSS